MKYSPFVLMMLFLVLFFGAACTEETKVDVSHNINPQGMPTMLTRNISTLISDSGVTQYKIVSPIWYVYDEADTPYWSFPKGLYLQKYDRKFKVIATVAADSARYFKDRKLWRLEGNVEMKKQPKDLFLSPRLYWDQRKQTLYSDTFIHIENATHVLEGTGFVSDENLQKYRILKPTGIFPANLNSMRGGGSVMTGPPPSAPSANQAATSPQPMAPTADEEEEM